VCGHRLVWLGHWPSKYFMSMNTRSARNPGLYLFKDRAGVQIPVTAPYTLIRTLGTVDMIDVLQVEQCIRLSY
jgi:hypothetical protein